MTRIDSETLISAAFGSGLVPDLIEAVLREAGRQHRKYPESKTFASAGFSALDVRIHIWYSEPKIRIAITANLEDAAAAAEICGRIGADLKRRAAHSIETDVAENDTSFLAIGPSRLFSGRGTIPAADLP